MGSPGTPVVFCTACGAHNPPESRFCQTCGRAMTAMPPLPATSSIAAFAEHPYGGFWIRLVAWCVDIVIVGILLPIVFAFGTLHFVGFGVGFFGWWLYEALLMSSSMQATLGKKLVGLKVTDLQNQRIGFGQATIRHFAKYLSALILGIGYLMVAFTERKQGLHDLIAGTVVQKSRP